MSGPDPALERLIAAGPWPARAGLRLALGLVRRPRGRALLALLSPADQAAVSLLAMARYDDPATARALGFDAAAVAARGRALRRDEGRP